MRRSITGLLTLIASTALCAQRPQDPVIERIIHPIGRRVDESSPLVDGRLPDGSSAGASPSSGKEMLSAAVAGEEASAGSETTAGCTGAGR